MYDNESIFGEIGKNCCFTGHRVLTPEQTGLAAQRIRRTVKALTSIGVTNFITGGALGFDTIAAQTVLELKRSGFSHIKLAVAVPCRDQCDRWRPSDVRLYKSILGSADETVCLSEKYTTGCMNVRNRFLVDHSAYCIAFVTRDTGGSAYTVKYARSLNKNVINLAEVKW